MINVTESYLPPFNVYVKYLKQIWESKWLTNRGQLVQELEEKLKGYLGVNNLTLTTNGTLPLQIALKSLDLKGEIITTPFSYVATTSVIVWENCTPIFVDIDPLYWTIDESKIEEAITDKTSAILATHVFGNPCNVDKIKEIANKHNLKVIYDAAHCFGVIYNGQSIFNYGDVSTCSFHATKIFHTGEGGCFVSPNKELMKKMFYHHNFGHDGTENFFGIGINAKMSELQAAMGMAVLENFDEILYQRNKRVVLYNDLLGDSNYQLIKIRPKTKWNYHYYPIVFESESKLLEVLKKFNKDGIFPRRYFYPSLNELPYIREEFDVLNAQSISKRILCLPLSHNLREQEIVQITKHLL